MPQIGERTFRRTWKSLELPELITETDEELAVPFSLVEREDKDAT